MRKWFFYAGIMVLLLFTAHQAFAQPINWDSVRSDYVKKYQPQQMPAWLFPIIFEEGGGQRDTVYLGYDEDAQDFGWPQSDTVFGEVKLAIDTSVFNASFTGFTNNTALKVAVWRDLSNGSSIECYKGILPLKMYWDREAFYSDSLPFPDQSPAPRAQGELGANMYSYNPDSTYCTGVDFMVLTDTGSGTTGDNDCRRSDSVVFFDFFGTQYVGEIYSFKITPWKGYLLGGIAKYSLREISVYPNPAGQFLRIHSNGLIQQVSLYDISGREVANKHTINERAFHWDIAHIPSGLYLLEVRTLSHSASQKIIITHK